MLGDAIAVTLISSLVLGPLLWRTRHDRRAEEALRLQAMLQSKANQRLGGETFLVVAVKPALVGVKGRVVLTAPERWQWLVQEVWNEIRRATPANYELVVSGAAEREQPAPGVRVTAASQATPIGRAG